MIIAEHLTKTFGEKTALDDVSFVAKDGRVTGFVGPNGSGKSTTLRMMLGLINSNEGRALIDGQKFTNSRDPMATVGAVLDAKSAHKNRSAYEHLHALALTNNIPVSRVDEVIEMTGLSTVKKEKAKNFSLGMSQRLSIAAALLGEPHNLILDEPVNGLDAEGVRWVRQLCRDYADRGRAVLLSSHLMSEVALTADDLVIIGRGKVRKTTSLTDFINENSSTNIRIATAEPEKLHAIFSADPTISVRQVQRRADDVPEGQVFEIQGVQDYDRAVGLFATAQLRTYELVRERTSLEDAYVALTNSQEEYVTRPAKAGDSAELSVQAQGNATGSQPKGSEPEDSELESSKRQGYQEIPVYSPSQERSQYSQNCASTPAKRVQSESVSAAQRSVSLVTPSAFESTTQQPASLSLSSSASTSPNVALPSAAPPSSSGSQPCSTTSSPSQSLPATTVRARPGSWRVSFWGSIRSEFVKLCSLKSTWCFTAIFVGLVWLVGILVGATINSDDEQLAAQGVEEFVDLSHIVSMPMFVAVIATVGVLSITGEYSNMSVQSSLVANPNRFSFFVAKAITVFCHTFVWTLIAVLLALASLFVGLSGRQRDVNDSELYHPWTPFLATFGSALAVALFALIAFGIGAICRSTAASMILMICMDGMFSGSLIILGLVSSSDFFYKLFFFMPSTCLDTFVSGYENDELGLYSFVEITQYQGPAPNWWQSGLTLGLWALVFMVVGALVFRRCDVK